MALTYVDNGPWGAGKLAPLNKPEFDYNTYTLHLRIQAVEDNPPEPVSISGFSQIGSQFFINLTDATQHGPFALPSPAVGAAPWRRVDDPVYIPVIGDAGRMLLCSTGCTVILPGGFYGDGAEIHVMQDSASPVVFDHDSDCTIRPPTGDDSRTARQGAVATAKWDESQSKWKLFGDLAAVSA